MKAVARWQDWSRNGLEHCVCREDDDGVTLESAVAGTRRGLYGRHYFVRTDAAFRTREVRVEYVDGPRLHVEADDDGHWHDLLGQRSLPDLDGCFDVDIGMTPATNTLPIKRLKLRQHESREITAAYVPLPGQIEGDLLPLRAEQRYTLLHCRNGSVLRRSSSWPPPSQPGSRRPADVAGIHSALRQSPEER